MPRPFRTLEHAQCIDTHSEWADMRFNSGKRQKGMRKDIPCVALEAIDGKLVCEIRGAKKGVRVDSAVFLED